MKTYINRLLVVVVALFVATVVFSQSNVQVTSAQTTPRTAFVHLFEWKWTDIATECEQWLGPKGFAAVQVSPPNEHLVLTGGSNPHAWWVRYQPVSYSIDKSRSGTRAQFIDMVTRCHNVGVNIYVDAIINHTAAGSGTGSNGHNFSYPNFDQFPYSSTDFHSSCDINYGAQDNGWSIRNCKLAGLPDLKTESSYVRGKILGYMNDMVTIGVAGFRVDGAKHMEPADVQYLGANVNNLRSDAGWFAANTRPYIYQEVIYGAGETSQPEQYVSASYTNLDVEEFRYGAKLGGKFRGDGGQKLSELQTFGSSWGMLGSDTAVAFTDNHDNQRGHGSGYYGSDGRIGGIVTFHWDSSVYALANVFELAWPYGYPRLMSSYDWTRNVQNGKDLNDWVGPPSTNGVTNNVTCFSGNWVCEHRWLAIANMVGFRNNVNSNWTVTNWWSNNNNQIAFGRGGKGFVVINKEGTTLSRTFATGMAAGTYCNVIVGNLNAAGNGCTGATITVDASGNAAISVGAMSSAAIHVGAKVGGTTPTITPTPTKTPTGPTPTKTITPTPTKTPTPGAGVAVTFKVNATTVMGENIYVVGNVAALGAWNTANAKLMSSASYPVWSITINLPANTAIEYKYIRKNGTTVTWESFTGNRTFTTPASGTVTRNETWNTKAVINGTTSSKPVEQPVMSAQESSEITVVEQASEKPVEQAVGKPVE